MTKNKFFTWKIMKIKQNRRDNGFGLVETLLTLGAVSALSLGIYLVLSPSSASAKAKVEQDNLRALSTAVDRSFGLLGSFEGVSADRVVSDRLAPSRMVDGAALRTSWGTSVTIEPHSINSAGDGFVVVYPLAPADVCPRLAAAVSPDVFDLRVGGVSVFDGGQLNPSIAAAACSKADTATMEFVYHSGLVAGTAVATPPILLPPTPPSVSTPTSPPVGGPVAPAAPVTPAAPVAPVTSAPSVAPPTSAPAAPAPSAPVVPTTPPSVSLPAPPPPITTVNACVVPSSWTQTESRSSTPCPAGQVGLVFESRSAQHSYTCPEAWAAPVETVGPWSAWAVTSTTCVPACTPPAPSSTAITRAASNENQTLGCPSGQVGSITQTRTRTERGTRTTSWTCPGPTSTTTDVWSGAYNYGAWTTTSNTCRAPVCSWTTMGTSEVQVNSVSAKVGTYGKSASGWPSEWLNSQPYVYNYPSGRSASFTGTATATLTVNGETKTITLSASTGGRVSNCPGYTGGDCQSATIGGVLVGLTGQAYAFSSGGTGQYHQNMSVSRPIRQQCN